jgi:hypothetical protein
MLHIRIECLGSHSSVFLHFLESLKYIFFFFLDVIWFPHSGLFQVVYITFWLIYSTVSLRSSHANFNQIQSVRCFFINKCTWNRIVSSDWILNFLHWLQLHLIRRYNWITYHNFGSWNSIIHLQDSI